MKLKFIFIAILIACVSAVGASSLSVSSGYAVSETPVTVTSGGYFGGFDVLPNGDYAVSDSLSLYEMTSGGTVVKTLWSTNTLAYGSFVRYYDGKIYFGESSNGTIKSADLASGVVSDFLTLAGNYDMEFYNGNMYVVAGNSVYDVTGGTTKAVLTVGKVSGALAFDAAGNVYYSPGDENYPAKPNSKNIYKWTAAQLTSGELLTESNAETVLANTDAPGGMLFYNSELYFTDSVTSPAAIKTLSGGVCAQINGYGWMTLLSNNASANGFSVAVSTMDASYNVTNVISTVTAVPEPASAVVLIFGMSGVFAIIRRRK